MIWSRLTDVIGRSTTKSLSPPPGARDTPDTPVIVLASGNSANPIAALIASAFSLNLVVIVPADAFQKSETWPGTNGSANPAAILSLSPSAQVAK